MPAKSSDPKSDAPLILACDTTQGACSVALYQGAAIAAQLQPMQKGHAEALLPMIERVMQEAGVAMAAVDRLAVTNGPGTFTGVRVGLSAMRGLALALHRPLKAYGTLAVMAFACRHDGPVIVAVDAKRDTFYTQAFDAKGTASAPPAALSGEAVVALAQALGTPVGLCGSGAALLEAHIAGATVLNAPLYPQAARLAEMAAADTDWPSAGAEVAATEPVYLRPPDATLPDPAKRIKWVGDKTDHDG